MKRYLLLALFFLLPQQTALAEDILTVKHLNVDLAVKAAQEALNTCRENGYNVSVVVVDRSAQVQVALRDNLASRFTIQIATKKANAVILSGVSSAEFRKSRADIKDEMNEVDGITVLEGGLPITAAGSMLAAIGVSGAPGGEKDAACAQKGIDAISETLEFAGD